VFKGYCCKWYEVSFCKSVNFIDNCLLDWTKLVASGDILAWPTGLCLWNLGFSTCWGTLFSWGYYERLFRICLLLRACSMPECLCNYECFCHLSGRCSECTEMGRMAVVPGATHSSAGLSCGSGTSVCTSLCYDKGDHSFYRRCLLFYWGAGPG
jgi:hypothetical protein